MDDLDRVARALSGRYAVERVSGRGGMACVYLATDLRHNRRVAVKVLRPDVSSAIGAERFRREIAIAAHLSHPYIVPVHDSGEADGLLFFVMPFIYGRTLREELDESGAMDVERALSIARDVAEGLDHAHSAGVIHRDIKPQNILLSGSHALIADFGVARAIQTAAEGSLTTSGIAVGTPLYMSPEQAAGSADVDRRSDVYSLGCVVYEMLTGKPPFGGGNARALLTRHIADKASTIGRVRKDLPTGLSGAVHRALEKSPDERYPTATAFSAQLDAVAGLSRSSNPGLPAGGWIRHLAKTRHARVLALLMLFAGLALVSYLVLRPRVGPPWGTEGPRSIVVLPFSRAGSSDADERLAEDLAAAISAELDSWETVRVVPQVALAGPSYDLGFRGRTLQRLEDARRLAQAFDVEAFVTVLPRTRGDSSDVDATLFDTRSGRAVGRPLRQRGPSASLSVVAYPIAARIVGLDPGAGGNLLRGHSANPRAVAAYAEGRKELDRWGLTDAESHFREATALDSGFALAHHRLAQTLYWRIAEDPGLGATLGAEVAKESAAALRNAGRLGSRDSLHIRAFFAFQAGDLDQARNLYNLLLGRDSTDVYSWLMLGAVEQLDPWLTEGGDGAWRPRGNLNRAVLAFEEALRLQPTFELGYSQLLAIHRDVVLSIDRSSCPTFEEPTGEEIAPWEHPRLRKPHPFCAAPLDSLTWLSEAAFRDAEEAARDGADRMFQQSLRLLRRWVDYSPTESRPRRELVSALLAQRSRLGGVRPDAADSLALEALLHAQTALRLGHDTVPADLFRLANLFIAVDSSQRGLTIAEEALALANTRGGGTAPTFAANTFLATGNALRALALVEGSSVTRAVEDPSTGELVPYGGAERVVERLRVLGAIGAPEPAVRDELVHLESLWAGLKYRPSQVAALRRAVALRVAPALVLVPGALRQWNLDLGLVEPLWQALVASDTAGPAAEPMLAQALADPTLAISEPTKAFLAGLAAARSGNHRQAAESFSRLDSLPSSIDQLDYGWGLKWQARFHRALSYEALGDTARALQDYESFSRAWPAADSLAAPLVENARRRSLALRARK